MCKRFFIWLSVLACFISINPDSLPAQTNVAETAPTRIVFTRVAVSSFLVGQRRPTIDDAMDDTLACPIGLICKDDPSILPNAGTTLTRLVEEQVQGRFGKQVVGRADVQAAEMTLKLDQERDTPRSLAEKLGRLLDADVVVIGTVWRYRDRKETVAQPQDAASVAFAVYFIEARTGRMLWRGLYDATQQDLFKDLLQAKKQIKMGLKWLTANELAAHGVQEVFSKFPPNILPGDYTGESPERH